jgi:hypothetical protein
MENGETLSAGALGFIINPPTLPKKTPCYDADEKFRENKNLCSIVKLNMDLIVLCLPDAFINNI